MTVKKISLYGERYYRHILLVIFLCAWVWSLWDPANYMNWFLENKMVILFIPIIYFLFIRYIKFSKVSLTFITVFLILHMVGAHYNYGSVPLGYALAELFGIHGNVYDKVVHFAFGFLIVYPVREFFLRIAKTKGIWGYIMPFNMILSMGALYEVFEWVTVIQYGNAIGYLFIGGDDPFDTTKDLAAAAIGAIIALSIVATCEWIELKSAFWENIKKSIGKDTRTAPKEDKILHGEFTG